MQPSSSPESTIEPMLFSKGIWLMVTPGGGLNPMAPPWLRAGRRSMKKIMSLGATPNSFSSTPRVHSAEVCMYSGTPMRLPFRSAGLSMLASLRTEMPVW